MLFIVLIAGTLLFALVAIVAALVVMNQQQSTTKTGSNKRVLGVLEDKDSKVSESQQSLTYEYYLLFRFELGIKKQFVVPKEIYVKYTIGDQGYVTYNQSTLVQFDVQEEIESHTGEEPYFFVHENNSDRTFDFYCDSPVHNIKIPSSEPIQLSVSEVFEFLDKLHQNHIESFMGIEFDDYCIQVFYNPADQVYEIDIPMIYKSGSYQKSETDLRRVKEMISEYILKQDVIHKYQFDFVLYR